MEKLRKARYWAVLGGSLLLGGCMVGPDFERPEAPLLDSWSTGADLPIDSRTGFTTRSANSVPWWHVFRDETLNGLIAQAYRQNVELQAAGVRVYQGARAARDRARRTVSPGPGNQWRFKKHPVQCRRPLHPGPGEGRARQRSHNARFGRGSMPVGRSTSGAKSGGMSSRQTPI